MAKRTFDVTVENDHIERITNGQPIVALRELIWNAFDADATEVQVEFDEGELTKLGTVRVIDDGTGIAFDEAESYFSSLGGSWKGSTRTTPNGRVIHGKKGQGRFKAFALGNSVDWISHSGGQQFSIQAHRSNLKQLSVSDPVPSSRTGCTVEIRELHKDYEIRAEHNFHEKLLSEFALKIFDDKAFSIIYDGAELDPREHIVAVTPFDIVLEMDDGTTAEGQLRVVEWKKAVDRKLHLCMPGGFSFYQTPPGIQAKGFEFTAYLEADHFSALADDNAEGLAELDPIAIGLINGAKDQLREHFREREADRARERIARWKSQQIYPYSGEASSPIERNERQVFEVVALSLADHSEDFEKSSDGQKQLVLQLIKTAVENGPASLVSVLSKVIDLPTDELEKIADLLTKTTLTRVVNAAKNVTDRLDFIRGLQLLIFNTTSKKQLLERSQLHRILANESWIFGEEFNLLNDDEDLTAVLRSHLSCFGEDRTDIAIDEPVLDEEGKVKIIDLMLSARVPTATDEARKHLVVELKRPSQKIDENVIAQIKKYAKTVAKDQRFNGTPTEWDFVAISNEFNEDGELEARQKNKPRGLVFELEEPRIRVWARTWGEIIQQAEGRMTFFKRSLEYQADDIRALRYLREMNQEYLSAEVRQMIEELGDDEPEADGTAG